MKYKNVAMIPARMGSTRFKKKNLAMIGDFPMIYYVIKAAKESGVFDLIVINSEDEAFAEIADRYGVAFYQRPFELGSSTTKSDDVVYDFMKKFDTENVAWVNSVSPLQSPEEIRDVVNYFNENKLDSLITAVEEKVHAIYDGKPVNFSFDDKFAQTQDLKPLFRFVYSVMMWKKKSFMDYYEKNGVAMMSGKFSTYPVDKLAGLIVKTERDFEICKMFLSGMQNEKRNFVLYDKVAKE